MKQSSIKRGSPAVTRGSGWAPTRSWLLLVLGGVILPASLAVAQQMSGPPPLSMPKDLPMQSVLYDAEQLAGRADLTTAQLTERLWSKGIRARADRRVHVEIVGPSDGEALPDAFVTRFGGELDTRWRYLLDAWVPVDRLSELARALPAGHFMERVGPLDYDQVEGEGPAVTNSISYRDGGADGTGLTIAVIDKGYDNLAEARDNGDAPPTGQFTLINYTSNDFEEPDDGTHGTGCVEAAFDHCPGATWRIYKTDSTADLGTAVDDAIDHGVDLITRSLSSYNKGWNDDEGAACDAANVASNNGVIFFTSAGNRANQHWQGNFDAGPDGDSWHNFSSEDESINISVPDGGSGNYYLAWDTSGGTYDYDMILYDAADLSELRSSVNGGNNFESFKYENTSGSTVDALLFVFNNSGLVTEFEIFLHGTGTWLEHVVSESSTTSPSNATGNLVISNGAVNHGDFLDPSGTDNIIMYYSSRGPSNSGMILPDLCGPTDTQGFTHSSFGGTSSATPNNAGAFCAFWSARPDYFGSGIVWLIKEHAKLLRDWGAAGSDNVYGEGGTYMWNYAANTTWLARDFNNTSEYTFGPNYTFQAAYDRATTPGRILIFPGGDYPEAVTATGTKRIDVETVVNPAKLGH